MILRVKSVVELVALTKPNAIAYASSGAGSSQALNDVLSGLVLVMFSPASSVLTHINSDKLNTLASAINKSFQRTVRKAQSNFFSRRLS